MSNRFLLEIDCRIRPEKRREFRLNIGAALPFPETPATHTCYEDQNEPGHMLIVEEWPTAEHLEHHLSSEAFQSMIGGFRVLGEVQDCRVVELQTGPDSNAPHQPIPRGIRGWRLLDHNFQKGPA